MDLDDVSDANLDQVRHRRGKPTRDRFGEPLCAMIADARPALFTAPGGAGAGRSRRVARTMIVAMLVALSAVSAGRAAALPPPPPGVAVSVHALQRLVVRGPGTLAGYRRDRFGEGWLAAGGGCDTRERVLRRDGRHVRVGTGCRALSGRWRSIYDGRVLRRSRAVDVDHVVPLANAWRSGVRAWSRAQHERFANDLRDPELIAVSAASNRAKGDSGPQSWRPPRRAVWCLYARWWIDVKR